MIRDTPRRCTSPANKTTGMNWHKDMLDAWSADNTSSNIPRLQYEDKDQNGMSDRFLMDASYLNLQNINFGYTLPVEFHQEGRNREGARLPCLRECLVLVQTSGIRSPLLLFGSDEPGHLFACKNDFGRHQYSILIGLKHFTTNDMHMKKATNITLATLAGSFAGKQLHQRSRPL